MQATIYKRYGTPEKLRLSDIERPSPADDEILVKVLATTVNRNDCALIRAKPFFMRVVTGLFRPKLQTPGTEFSGIVEAAGKNVVSFSKGDQVFGFNDSGSGAQAEYLLTTQDFVVRKPENNSFQQAAASSEGAHYAYNFINKVNLQKGQNVLVNGSSGAIGSAAVQLLKYYGAKVTAVCSTRNIDLVKSLGADRIIDYTLSDFTDDRDSYDAVFDMVGKSSFFKCIGIMKHGGIYISSDLGFLAQNIYLPLITRIVKPLIGNRKTIFPTPVNIKRSLLLIKDLTETGKFHAVIDSCYSLEQIVDAYHYVEKGHKTGNVVVTVSA